MTNTTIIQGIYLNDEIVSKYIHNYQYYVMYKTQIKTKIVIELN
jgi:hypothetical protein